MVNSIRQNERRAGIAFAWAAALTFTFVDATVKWLSPHLPTTEIVFFRGLFALIPVLGLLPAQGGVAAIRTVRPIGHLIRAGFAVTAILASFYAFGRMPLADVVAISFAAPLFVTGLSIVFLGEQVGIHRWSALGAGFLGVVIMVRPGANFDWVALVALAGSLCTAGAAIIIRHMSNTERAVTIVFYHSIATTLAAAGTIPFAWTTPEPAAWTALAAVGLLGGVAQLLQTESYRRAPVSVVAPYQYSSIIWASLIGYWVWDDVPDLSLLAGAVLVIASVLYILHRETRPSARPAA